MHVDAMGHHGSALSAQNQRTTGGVPVAMLRLRRGEDDLRLFVLLTSIGTGLDVTAQELTVETLFPADDATERWFRTPMTS